MSFDPTLISLVAILGVMVLAIFAMFAWGHYHQRASRLPEATRHDDIRERLAVASDEFARKQAELRELEQKIHQRDRFAAEVEIYQRRLEEIRLELENLSAAREEISKVKAEAGEAAAEKAELQRELDELLKKLADVRAQLDPERIAGLQRRKEETEQELSRISRELEASKSEWEAALRVIAEARMIEADVAARRAEIETLRAEISRLESERGGLDEHFAQTRAARESAQQAFEQAERDRKQTEQLARENAEEIRQAAEQERKKAEQELADLQAEITSRKTMRDQLAKGVLGTGTGGGPPGQPTEEQRQAMLADLVTAPAFLESPAMLRGALRQERDALHDVRQYLVKQGLKFSDRTLNAFHTALKVNDTSQLTVLAGVSGTGKSILPRSYAEAMGIHFLQVAVEPRWDSPQDLLGFYNYVEQKYRATDLARLLAHLDPWQRLSLPEGSPDRSKHMALVLLDEMNLARVEYYFSEFLSRLEARPTWRPGLVEDDFRDAVISVDIRGLERPPRLVPGHNVLFVGTMNDDESTQSLSDKVLDRGNIMQFPAPKDFEPSAPRNPAPAVDAQSFDEWRGWVNEFGRLPSAAQDKARKTVSELAAIMEGFGRPFGHRLNQAILAYAANYPSNGNAGPDIDLSLADQIEFRILPKLRGVEIDQRSDEFEKLSRLIQDQLGDAQLADGLKQTMAKSKEGSGLFVWRGLNR